MIADMAVDVGVFPDAARESRLLHVGAGADGRGADGSRDRPYPTVERAYAEAQAGDVVFLLPGRHSAGVEPPAGVELLGSGSVTELEGPLVLTHDGARVGELTVLGGVTVEGSADLNGLVIRGGSGLWVQGSAEMRSVTVGGVMGDAVRLDGPTEWRGGGVEGADGWCVVAEASGVLEALELRGCGGGGARLVGAQTLDRVEVEGSGGTGVEVNDGPAEIGALTVTGQAAGTFAVDAREAELSLASLRVSNGGRGLRASGGRVEAGEILARGVEVAVNLVQEADAALGRVEATGVSEGGVSVIGARAEVARLEVEGAGRFGLLVSDSAEVVADVVEVAGSEMRGVSFLNSTGTIGDIQVEAAAQIGVQVAGESVVEIAGGSVRGCRDAGLAVSDGTLRLGTVTVSGTERGPDGLAEGLHVFGGRAELAGTELRANAGAGLLVEGGGVVTANGGGTHENSEPGAVLVNAGASEFTEFAATANASAGFLVIESAVTLTDVDVESGRLGPDGAGDGVAAVVSAELVVRGGRYRNNAANGVFVLGGSRADIAGAEFAGNAGFGVAGCNVEIVESAENTYRNNTRGARQPCE